MTVIEYDLVRVFTDETGCLGNPLAVVYGAAVPQENRQQVAAALGYSETVFVDDAEDGRIQIFTPASELPFAGHPTVGTAWLLHHRGMAVDHLVVPAGEVSVARDGDITRVRARGEWTTDFAWHQLPDADAVEAADPDDFEGGPHYCWAWTDPHAGGVRSRMFAGSLGITEDEATGAAAIAFTCLQQRDLDITQGHGSRLYTTWEGEGWATVGGRVVLEGRRSLAS